MHQSSFISLGLLLLACGGGPPAPAQPQQASAPPHSEAQSATDTEAPGNNPASAAPSSGAANSADATDKKGPVTIVGDGSDAPIEFNDSKTAKFAEGATPSEIEPTDSETAMRFFVVDKAKAGAPIEGIVICMTAPDGKKYYTKETDSTGYAEVLVPVGQSYELAYLSLGRRDITAKVPVPDEPQNLKLTLRYQRWEPPPSEPKKRTQVFVLKGVTFDTGKATIRPESFQRLDSVLEYMTHKPKVRIEISGHTDNVGKPEANKLLSQQRAEACRDYLVSKGIDKSRIDTVGYGDEQPVASNDTPLGRQKNRRIEARELQ